MVLTVLLDAGIGTVMVALLAALGLDTISDGLWPRPVTRDGCTWIPQQLWDFRPKPAGVWTVCLHHNKWTEADFQAFERGVAAYASRMTNLEEVMTTFRGRRGTLQDSLVAQADWVWHHGLRTPALDRLRKRLRNLLPV